MTDPLRPQQVMHRVLVVEDDYELADMLTEILTHENCIADRAANGMEALDKISSGDYDAIVCDLLMPRLDGESLYRQTERDNPYLADKFIFITGQASRRAGYTDFIRPTGNAILEKPFDLDEFRRTLQELFARI